MNDSSTDIPLKKVIISIFFIFSMVAGSGLVASCSQAMPTANPQTSQPETQPVGIATAIPPDAYPAPAQEAYIIAEIPTPSADMAIITGIIVRGTVDPEPAGQIILSLASIIDGSDGKPKVARFDRNSAPRTISDDVGRFVFLDVAPGQYALIVDRINDAFLLNDPDTGGDFLINAEPGKVLDLGELVHPALPGEEP